MTLPHVSSYSQMLLCQSGVQPLLYPFQSESSLPSRSWYSHLGYFTNYNPRVLLGIVTITSSSLSLPLKSDLLSQTQLHRHSMLEAKVKQQEGEDETVWKRTGPQALFRSLCDSIIDQPPSLLCATNPRLVLNSIAQIKVSSSICVSGSVSSHPSQLQCLDPDSQRHSRVSTDRETGVRHATKISSFPRIVSHFLSQVISLSFSYKKETMSIVTGYRQ